MSLPSLGYKSDSFMPWDEAIHILQFRVIRCFFHKNHNEITRDIFSGSINGSEVDAVKVLAKKHNFEIEKIKKEPAWGKPINGKRTRE